MQAADATLRRVLVCDDSIGYRMLIHNWCEMSDGVESAGEAANREELLGLLPSARPDVLLLDLMLGDEPSSPELVESIRGLLPGIRIVLVSSMPDDVLLEHSRAIGADGYCPKLASADELLQAIAP